MANVVHCLKGYSDKTKFYIGEAKRDLALRGKNIFLENQLLMSISVHPRSKIHGLLTNIVLIQSNRPRS